MSVGPSFWLARWLDGRRARAAPAGGAPSKQGASGTSFWWRKEIQGGLDAKNSTQVNSNYCGIGNRRNRRGSFARRRGRGQAFHLGPVAGPAPASVGMCGPSIWAAWWAQVVFPCGPLVGLAHYAHSCPAWAASCCWVEMVLPAFSFFLKWFSNLVSRPIRKIHIKLPRSPKIVKLILLVS
jgi:hypothetical protein